MDYQLLKGQEDEVDYLFLTGTLTRNNVFYKVAIVENVDYGGEGKGNYHVVLQSQAGTFSFVIHKDWELDQWVQQAEETGSVNQQDGIKAGEIIIEKQLLNEMPEPVGSSLIDAEVVQEIGTTIEQIKMQYVLLQQRKAE